MKRILAYLLLAAVAVTAPSCRRAAEKAASQIHFRQVESLGIRSDATIEATLRIDNGSAYRLALDRATADLCFAARPVARLTLVEGVTLARRTEASVTTRWRLDVRNPLLALQAAGRLRRGDLESFAVTFAVEGTGGPVKVNFSREMMPLSDFLSTFGLTFDDIKEYLKP